MSAGAGTAAISVHTSDERYAAATAELPRSTRRAKLPAGSVVVLSGQRGWEARAVRARDAGAIAVVVDNPRTAGHEHDLDALVDLSRQTPSVIARPRVRADVALDALRHEGPGTVGRLVAVECVASASFYPEIVRDAIGWARILAAGQLVLRAVGTTGVSTTAHFEIDTTASPFPITLLAARRDAGPEWLRARTVHATRTEVVIQGARNSTAIEFASAAGLLRPPPRLESYERLALRRVVQALGEQVAVQDAEEFRHDERLATAVLGSTG